MSYCSNDVSTDKWSNNQFTELEAERDHTEEKHRPTLGEPGFHLAHQLIGRALVISGETDHLYDKPEMQKQRKMGHITIVGPSMGIVEARLKSMLNVDILDGQAAGENSVSTPDPEMMFSYALSARGRGIQIIIAGAGGAALLPGMVAALTPLACYWCSCTLLITGWT